MVEGGEDIRSAAISDVASVDMDGADTINEVNLETQNSTYTTAINSIILALEKAGIIVDN